ncbi:hypothetical protein ACD471_14075
MAPNVIFGFASYNFCASYKVIANYKVIVDTSFITLFMNYLFGLPGVAAT